MPAAGKVPAAEQVLAVLSELGRHAGPVPAAALAQALGLPRSTTYQLLAALRTAGFVVHLPDERRYALGVGAYELAIGYTRQAPLARLARVPLAGLVDRTGFNAHLAVLHGREVVYLLEERAPGRPPLITDVGVRLPAQLTASGRAILADLGREQVRALFADPSAFVLRHGTGPRTLSGLRRLLSDVRGAGYASEAGDVTPGFSSIAVAVRDHNGFPVAAVALTYRDGADNGAADPLRSDPSHTDPSHTDPSHTQPSHIRPNRTTRPEQPADPTLVRAVADTAKDLSRRIGG